MWHQTTGYLMSASVELDTQYKPPLLVILLVVMLNELSRPTIHISDAATCWTATVRYPM